MGRFRSKLKGQTKGKRWQKGQSSSSNPETHKYRDLARSRFFQENLGSSALTTAALRTHDAVHSLQTNINQKEPSFADDETVDSSQYSFESMDSFASSWSGCSNMSFNRFLKVFRSDSALHKEMLAILAAVKDVIVSNGGTETPTEYFASLMTTLDEIYKTKDEFQISAVLSLLNMGIKSVPDAVIKTQFSLITEKMIIILKDYVVSDNNTVIKALFGILAHCLKIQEAAAWNYQVLQIFSTILNPFCLHSKPKWRKSAQHAVITVVKMGGFKEISPNLAADEVAKFCEQTLDAALGKSSENTVLVSSLQSGQTSILHVLGLMKEVIVHFSKKYIKSSCEVILKLMTLNYPIVTSCGLQVLYGLFSNQQAVIPGILNAQLITALYDYQPAANDVQPTLAWLTVMQQAHVHLSDVDVSLASNALPKIFQTAVQLWLSEKPEINTCATHALEILLKDAVTPLCMSKELVEQYQSKISSIFSTIESGLSYQYHNVWNQVLHTIAIMFEVGGINCGQMFINTVKSLSELRDSYKFSHNAELEYAIGAAVRYLGPELVLEIIPLKKENGDLNIDRSWLLPVLRENIKHSSLDYFVKNILSLAIFCQKRSAELAAANDRIGAHSTELLSLQLWNLLPCFCSNPSDIKDNFKNMAKLLGMAISERKELRLAVMASIRKLILSAQNNENNDDLSELARFDKNYLPILFNIYTTKPIGTDEEGHRLAALETIKLYLTIAKDELKVQLFSHALERLNSNSEDPEDSFVKESIFDLIRVLIPYQSLDNIKKLYDTYIKTLPTIENKKEQKKAYRILEEICSSKTENCKNFIDSNRKDVQRLLKKTLKSSAISSRGARLRCLNYLLAAQPQLDHDSKLIKTLLPEAVLACKDINSKCRQSAYQVLQDLGERLIYKDQVDEFLVMLVSGLGGTDEVISCTLLAFSSILDHFSGSLGIENIQKMLENVITLMESPKREIVSPCIVFIKTYLKTLPTPIIASSIPNIIKSLTKMTEDCQRHFRLKTRDILMKLIRKFGVESITPHVPPTDVVMYKRIRNLRKLYSRKKRSESLKGSDDEDDQSAEEFSVKAKQRTVEEILADSDSELEEMEVEETKTKKTRKGSAWIEEDPDSIIDFIDPTVARKITVTKPAKQQFAQDIEKQKKKDKGFKTAPDGRLIIDLDESSDSEDEKGRKNNIMLDSDSDSDNENRSVAATLPLTNLKRKHGSSVKSGFSSSSTVASSRYKSGGVGIHRPIGSSSVKSGMSGKEYTSKKAKGDIKKKGSFDPYAYLPLQRAMLNKRKKIKAAGQFKNIVKGARKGALKGKKAKRLNNK